MSTIVNDQVTVCRAILSASKDALTERGIQKWVDYAARNLCLANINYCAILAENRALKDKLAELYELRSRPTYF